MARTEFGYAYEKLADAGRTLMAPHPGDEDQAFVSASHECSLALNHLNLDDIDDDSPKTWIRRIQRAMDTSGIDDSEGRGTLVIKIGTLTEADRME